MVATLTSTPLLKARCKLITLGSTRIFAHVRNTVGSHVIVSVLYIMARCHICLPSSVWLNCWPLPSTTIQIHHLIPSMSYFIPLLTRTNHRISSQESKRKCIALAQKAAPTCILSLTSVSISAHGSSESLNPVPFPSSPAVIPFPSSPVQIPTSTSPTKCSPSSLSPRPRLRSQPSLFRRKRSSARLLQPCTLPCSSQVESEPDQLSSIPPRKRARKASISSSLTSSATKTAFNSLIVSRRKENKLKKVNTDLRFLCTVYRSIAWLRLQRDLNEAAKSLMNIPKSMDIIDIDPMCTSALDAQESLLLSRLRSYLLSNGMSPQWLDMTPLQSTPLNQEADMDMDIDVRGPNLSPDSSPQFSAPFHLPIITQEQVTASLWFRYRYRSKGRSKPVVVAPGRDGDYVRTRRKSPLAGSEASWVLGYP